MSNARSGIQLVTTFLFTYKAESNEKLTFLSPYNLLKLKCHKSASFFYTVSTTLDTAPQVLTKSMDSRIEKKNHLIECAAIHAPPDVFLLLI